MKLRNLIKNSIIDNVDVESDYGEYLKLENDKVPLIKKEDLPFEFSDESFETIIDFVEKTRNLDYEWIIFFDYFTGEILKCVKGERKNVNVEFDVNEFKGFHVASIHNHPENVYSPPSGKNFGIFARDFEDYELISGSGYFWILKAKGTYEYLVSEMNIVSNTLFNAAFAFCSLRYDDSKIINNMCDIRYGNELIKYINNKNISDIQLIKKEYVAMDINSEHAIYGCREWITDPEAIRIAREYERNPNTLSGKDMVFALYHMLGMDVDYDEIFAD